FSTKCVSSGTGLGLYIAKMIVEHNLHGALSYRNIDGCVEFSIAL
ncbi:MAG: HAMP domain-containing histidine kinase, partial [Nitrospirae bacterium]|nr:HAMP domain-containing histidine kinase [Nitrospirota bacterium]